MQEYADDDQEPGEGVRRAIADSLSDELRDRFKDYWMVDSTADTACFRLREDKRTGANTLDYHRVLSEFETEETEVPIDSGADGREILARLGHDVECVVDKRRTEYECDDVVITIDRIDGLGDFVEIEMGGTLIEEKNDDSMPSSNNLISMMRAESRTMAIPN